MEVDVKNKLDAMWQSPPEKEKQMNLGPYGKAIVAAAGALALYLSDNVFSVSDGVEIALAVLTALGVYAVPNKGYHAHKEGNYRD